MRKRFLFLLALLLALTGCTKEPLHGPPELTASCGGSRLTVISGNYSLDRDNGDDTRSSVIACGAHPLQCRDSLTPFAADTPTVQLEFDCPPDGLSVRCWSDTQWDDLTAQAETASIRNGALTLLPGGYIYEVSAQWSSQEAFSGSASYVFYVIYDQTSP